MRAALHSVLSDLLHERGLVDNDEYAMRVAKALEKVRPWEAGSLMATSSQVSTNLFHRHPGWNRKRLLPLLVKAVLKRWPKCVNQPSGNERNGTTKVKVLFLASNPTEVVAIHPRTGGPLTERPLGLDREFRAIQVKLRLSKFRSRFDLSCRLAMTPDDLLQAFNEESPHIVHFSGHGTRDELVLEDDAGNAKVVSKGAIKSLFAVMKGRIRVVVLNACFSESQAEVVTRHIDCAIGMRRAIGDETAIKFASAFYSGLGFGVSIRDAFDQALVAVRLAGLAGVSIPRLIGRRGVNLRRVSLIKQ